MLIKNLSLKWGRYVPALGRIRPINGTIKSIKKPAKINGAPGKYVPFESTDIWNKLVIKRGERKAEIDERAAMTP